MRRGKMKWPGRFPDALTNATEVFNYYSSGDAVFTEVDGIPDLLDDVVHWDGGLNWLWHVIPYPDLSLAFENHCWQKQEVMKGMFTPAGTASGGWGFHCWPVQGVNPDDAEFVRYSAATVAAMVADGSITNNPVFNRGATELLNPNASLADQRLALAKHVPAISTAMGRTSAWEEKIENHDLNGAAYQNGWGRHHSSYGTDWQHSDMKDMAYFYVYKLYDEIVNQKGSLK